MACGTAVVASRSRRHRRVIEDGVSGLLVPARDVEALATALSSLMSIRSARGRWDCSHERIARDFSAEAMAENTWRPTGAAPS